MVVGAGLAGLSCAARLTEHLDVHILEARDRVGGRCWSSHGWDDDQVAEHGGEQIEAGQESVLGLAAELGLELESRAPDAPATGYASLGDRLTDLDVLQGLPEILSTLDEQLRQIGRVNYRTADKAMRSLDDMSAQDWIDEYVDGGGQSPVGLALGTSVALNLGFRPSGLSALSLHHMFLGLAEVGEASQGFSFGNENAGPNNGDLPELGDTIRSGVTHHMHIKGGNDLLASRLAGRLPPGTLHLNSPVIEVQRRSDGRYITRTAGEPGVVVSDRVVFTNPLPTLKEIDLLGAALSDRRRQSIDDVAMGTGYKVLVQMTAQPDSVTGWPGFILNSEPAVVVWNSSTKQSGNAGLLTFFGQGTLDTSNVTAHAVAPDSVARVVRSLLSGVSSDVENAVAHRIWLDDWAHDQWAQGSYAGFSPGQYSRFAGFLSEAEGGVHFAGEHTSLSSPGYLDGAIASGHRAAAEVTSSLGIGS